MPSTGTHAPRTTSDRQARRPSAEDTFMERPRPAVNATRDPGFIIDMADMTAPPHGAHDTSALVHRVVAGDAAAFAALVARYEPLVYRWAVALCGDEDDAEDV